MSRMLSASGHKPATVKVATEEPKELSRNRLFVCNIPFRFRDEHLLKLFSLHEPCIAEVAYNERGSRGFGFVTLSSSEMCEKARADLNGVVIDGRVIEVRRATMTTREKGLSDIGSSTGTANLINGIAQTFRQRSPLISSTPRLNQTIQTDYGILGNSVNPQILAQLQSHNLLLQQELATTMALLQHQEQIRQQQNLLMATSFLPQAAQLFPQSIPMSYMQYNGHNEHQKQKIINSPFPVQQIGRPIISQLSTDNSNLQNISTVPLFGQISSENGQAPSDDTNKTEKDEQNISSNDISSKDVEVMLAQILRVSPSAVSRQLIATYTVNPDLVNALVTQTKMMQNNNIPSMAVNEPILLGPAIYNQHRQLVQSEISRLYSDFVGQESATATLTSDSSSTRAEDEISEKTLVPKIFVDSGSVPDVSPIGDSSEKCKEYPDEKVDIILLDEEGARSVSRSISPSSDVTMSTYISGSASRKRHRNDSSFSMESGSHEIAEFEKQMWKPAESDEMGDIKEDCSGNKRAKAD